MLLSIFCLGFLVASNLSAVLLDQESNDTPDDKDSSTSAENLASLTTPSNLATLSGTSFQDNANSLELQGNEPETIRLTDDTLAGAGSINSEPGSGALNSWIQIH